ncbi:O-antigen ligase family protein [Methylobacterium tarhaniae]|uniref:O-antigen ligase family protein n=1 Tax=Methylobacterium tarhaniae TaxID=1187852 RepID=UPI0009F887DB|nr:O-antigen ligase family protein [Methylobacterium tarhaniae]
MTISDESNSGVHHDSWIAVFALLLLFALTAAAPLTSLTGGDVAGEGSLLRQVGFIVIFGVAFVGVKGYSDLSKIIELPRSIILTLMFCAVTLYWAIDPEIGARRLILTCVIISTIFMLVHYLSIERSIEQARIVLSCVLLANFASVLLFPQYAIHQEEAFGDPGLAGDWRGIYPEKNAAGAITAFTIILYIFHAGASSVMYRAVIVGASFVFLYFSGSKTSFALVILSIIFGWIYSKYNSKYNHVIFWSLCFVLCVMGIIMMNYWDELLMPFSREDALTGRVQIWPIMIAYLSEHPFGAGFGSFWNIGADSPIYVYSMNKTWIKKITSAHNGYLDIASQIGLVGLGAVVITFVIIPLSDLAINATVYKPRGAIVFAILIFCIGHNFTESSILDRDNIVQIFFMFSLALLSTMRKESPLDTVSEEPSRSEAVAQKMYNEI